MERELVTLHERGNGYRHMLDVYEIRHLYEDEHGAMVMLHGSSNESKTVIVAINETLDEVIELMRSSREESELRYEEEDDRRTRRRETIKLELSDNT